MKLLIINGPNLNLLGLREPAIYGTKNYAALVAFCEDACREAGFGCEVFQSNHEGAMSNGHGYGTHYVSNPNFQYYRLEIHTDNLIYIKKVDKEVSEDCRDATEFQPPIIIDGEVLQNDYWVELNPRVCIGQSDKYEMLLLVIEGRLYTEGNGGVCKN